MTIFGLILGNFYRKIWNFMYTIYNLALTILNYTGLIGNSVLCPQLASNSLKRRLHISVVAVTCGIYGVHDECVSPSLSFGDELRGTLA